MPVLNATDLKAALVSSLRESGEVSPAFKSWVYDSATKWLLTKSPNFITTFTTPVVANTMGFFQQGADGTPLKTYYYVDLSNRRQRLFLEDRYQQLDAEKGLLTYFLPKKNLMHWLYSENPLFVHARDFFEDLLSRKPDEDLRKYTLDTLPAQIGAWHEQLAVERARRAAEEAQLLKVSADAATREGFEAILRAKWKFMVEGVDYVVLGEVHDQVVLQLLSPRSLDWEADYKGSCIDGHSYKQKLTSAKHLLLSTRAKTDLSSPFYTVEMVKDPVANAWELVQFEHWGYMHSQRNSQETVSSHFMTVRRELEVQMPVLSEKTKKAQAAASSLEFVLTQRQTF